MTSINGFKNCLFGQHMPADSVLQALRSSSQPVTKVRLTYAEENALQDYYGSRNSNVRHASADNLVHDKAPGEDGKRV